MCIKHHNIYINTINLTGTFYIITLSFTTIWATFYVSSTVNVHKHMFYAYAYFNTNVVSIFISRVVGFISYTVIYKFFFWFFKKKLVSLVFYGFFL